MAVRIEVKFKPGITDALGKSTQARIRSELGIELEEVKTIEVYTIDKELSSDQLERIRREIFTDPLTQQSAVARPLAEDFDLSLIHI